MAGKSFVGVSNRGRYRNRGRNRYPDRLSIPIPIPTPKKPFGLSIGSRWAPWTIPRLEGPWKLTHP